MFVMQPFGTTVFVSTIDKTKLGTHDITLTNTLSYLGVTWTPSFTFTVTVVDPCETTVWVDFTIPIITTDNGIPIEQEMEEIKDSVEVAKGQNTLCGPRTYTIAYQDGTAIDWVTIATSVHTDHYMTITVDPTLDEHEATHDLALTMSLDYYPNHAAHVVNFEVIVTTPTCECDRITYDPPAD